MREHPFRAPGCAGDMLRPVILGLSLLALGACDFPRDAENTLARVRETRVLRVGASENEPWVRVDRGEIAGAEAAIVRAFAQRLGAQVVWTRGAESTLVESLEEHRLDLVVGGLTDGMPWRARVGVSRPYVVSEVVIGVTPPQGTATTASEDWRGDRISFPPTRPHFATFIESIKAVPVPAREGQAAQAVALYAFELESHGLVRAGPVMHEERRVVAVAPGENALLFELDRFLAEEGPRLLGGPAPR